MANCYKTTSLRGQSAVSQLGAGKRMVSDDGQRVAVSRNQKRHLPGHRYDIVECWTLKKRERYPIGRLVNLALQRSEDEARKFIETGEL